MLLLHAPTDLPPVPKSICLAIGVFDGVHLGHQQVIRQMVADARQHEARSIVITFDRHPNTVVAPQRVPPYIYTLPQKLRAIAALEVDATMLIHFDEPFSRQPGEQFIRGLARDFGHIHSICVGSNFSFGYRRSGNVALLQQLGHELNFKVHGLAAVCLDGESVSSTRIREAIRAGQLDLVGQMLGRGYSLAGPVVHGDHLGRQLGFPTANIDTAGLVLPPTGVYAVHAAIQPPSPLSPSLGAPARTRRNEVEAGNGVKGAAEPAHAPNPAVPSHRALLNIGYRPTLEIAAPQLRVEAFLFDFSGDLYGQELEITFVDKIREERKFPSLDALKGQLQLDLVAALGLFSRLGRFRRSLIRVD